MYRRPFVVLMKRHHPASVFLTLDSPPLRSQRTLFVGARKGAENRGDGWAKVESMKWSGRPQTGSNNRGQIFRGV